MTYGNTIFHFALKNSRMDAMNYIILKFFSLLEAKKKIRQEKEMMFAGQFARVVAEAR